MQRANECATPRKTDAGSRRWSGPDGHGGCSQRGGLQFSSWQEQSDCGLLSWNVNKAVSSALIFTTKTELHMKLWTSLVVFSFSFFLFGNFIVVCPGFFFFRFLSKNFSARLPLRAGMVLKNFGK